MTERTRILIALVEDTGSITKIPMTPHKQSVISFPGHSSTSSGFCRYQTFLWFTDIHVVNSHTHNKKEEEKE